METMTHLMDQHGRRIRKLRLSLTDVCNLRCQYCMPEDAQFMDKSHYISALEYGEIVSELCEFGLEELRLTGGEPLVRNDFDEIVNELAKTKVKKIALTTNALTLDRYFDILKENRVHHLNISLDSLDAHNFERITRRNRFHQVMRNIEMANDLGFVVKINMVCMRGVNDHEIFDFVKLSQTLNIEVRFLEVMRIGVACSSQNSQFIAASEIISRLKEHFEMKPVSMPIDSTSFNFLLSNGAQIGFIASESAPFCGACSRWRMSADATLRACLFKDDGLSVKNKTSAERLRIYRQLLGMKPISRPSEVHHLMHEIGG